MASLNETQRREVARWIEAGQKLSEIQTRLDKEMGQRITYMEVRLLVNELQVMPKDPEPVKPPEPKPEAAVPSAPAPEPLPDGLAAAPVGGGKVSVSVDQITRSGAIVSGKVTFSDGVTADWFLGQDGRLGLAAKTKGYRPPAADVPEFQATLERELARIGM
jgi:hypothetical protein